MKHNIFFQYLEHEKRFSPNTLLAYQRDLNQFFSYLHIQYEIDRIELIRHFHIRSWIVELMKTHKLTNKSINRKLSCLRSYFKFAQKQGLEKNPMKKVVAPKTGKKLPVFVQEAAIEKILDPRLFANDFVGERDRVVLELLYTLGLRRSELLAMEEKNIDLKQRNIKVLGKGNKERIIPMTPGTADILQAYMKLKTEQYGAAGPIFVTKKGRPMYPKYLYNLVKKYLSLIPTLEQKSPHVLRHTFATHMANQGADLNAIKELLGHASLAATQVYTHNSIDQLIKVYQSAHPKADV